MHFGAENDGNRLCDDEVEVGLRDWGRVEQKEVGHGGDKKQIILYCGGGDKRTKTMNH